jgi:hypothetical protein
MKPRKITLISLALMVTILVGAVAILATPPTVVGANVRCNPRYFEMEGQPNKLEVQIRLKGGHSVDEINPNTILLEGMYSPQKTEVNRKTLVATFRGGDVRSAIETKLGHMSAEPGRYRVQLEISGYLTEEYGSLPFSGSGRVTVTVPPELPPI